MHYSTIIYVFNVLEIRYIMPWKLLEWTRWL